MLSYDWIMLRKTAGIAAAIFLTFLAEMANAAPNCHINNKAINGELTRVDFGNISVKASDPVGTVYGSLPAYDGRRTIYQGLCYESYPDVKQWFAISVASANSSSAVSDVLALPGNQFGVRVRDGLQFYTAIVKGGGNGASNGLNSYIYPRSPGDFYVKNYIPEGSNDRLVYQGNLYLQLVKLVAGAPAASSLGAQDLYTGLSYMAMKSVVGSFALDALVHNLNVSYNANLSPPTCTIPTPDQTVTLANTTYTALNNVGDTAGTKNFTINMTCESGVTLKAKLTDSTTPSNATNVLTNTVAATQGGIGIQIVRAGTPVNFGSTFTVGTYASTTSVSIALAARYIRTGGTFTAGNVQGVFTYTLTYQ